MISLKEEDANEIEQLGSQSNEIIVGDHNSASYLKKVASFQEHKDKSSKKSSFKWCIALQCVAIVVLLALLTSNWYKQSQEDHSMDRKPKGTSKQEDTRSGNNVIKVFQKQTEEKEKQHQIEQISNSGYSQKDSQNTNVVREIEKNPEEEKPAKETSRPKNIQQDRGQSVAKEVVAAYEFPENVAKWPSEADRESTSWYTSYEDHRPNEALNLWDLSPSEKVSLLRSYQSLPQSSKPQKTDDYMQINYNKSEGFIEFQKKFQADIEVVDWSSIELTAAQEQKMKYDYDFALKERLGNLQRIIKKYKAEFVGKTGYIKQEKEITYQEFMTSLEYQRLTGQNFRQNQELNQLYQRQKDLHQNKYKTEQHKQELHACIVAPTYNNDVDFRYAWHLESVLQQDYSNYRMVIIDDASTDQTSSKIAMHLRWRNVSKDKVVLIKNKVHRTALENIAYGVHKYCDYNQISYIIDGDDELAGTQVFKFFNAMYQRQKLYVLYTNYFDYDSKNSQDPVKLGISERYPSEIVQKMDFREQAVHSYSHLRTMITDLFLFLRKESFLDSKGQFYWTIYDNAMYFPALEMSCGKLDYLSEIKYWYTANTGFNDWRTTKQKQYRQVKLHIQKEQKKYHCIDNVFKMMHYAVSQ